MSEYIMMRLQSSALKNVHYNIDLMCDDVLKKASVKIHSASTAIM